MTALRTLSTGNIVKKVTFAITLLSSLMMLATISATEAEKKEEKKSDSVKYSDLKKPKAVATGDKIYTWIDESGNRMYSDVPKDGAEVMQIEEGTNYSAPGSAAVKDYSTMEPKVVPSGNIYSHFAIISPANDQTIRNNNGDFQVAIDIRPKLGIGHSIRLEMNGKVVQSAGSAFISLANIDRGTHTLVAIVLDADGKTLRKSKPVTIHLHRAH